VSRQSAACLSGQAPYTEQLPLTNQYMTSICYTGYK